MVEPHVLLTDLNVLVNHCAMVQPLGRISDVLGFTHGLGSTCLDFCCGQVKFCRLISVGPTSEKGRVDSVQEEEGLRPRLPSLSMICS